MRLPDQLGCSRCLKARTECLETAPRARGAYRSKRIQEAKQIYGNAISSTIDSSCSSTPSAFCDSSNFTDNTARLQLRDGRDASDLVCQLVRDMANFRLARYPLLRWLELPGPFADQDLDFNSLNPTDQAL